jgi:N-acetylneuraminic acid mutarotase
MLFSMNVTSFLLLFVALLGAMRPDQPLASSWAEHTAPTIAPPSMEDQEAPQVWAPLSTVGMPHPRVWHAAVWTGTEVLIWGGSYAEASPVSPSLVIQRWPEENAAYNPRLDRWRPISREGAPSPRQLHHAIWTGREMLIWGGMGPDGRTSRNFDDGAAYDPVADRWRPIAPNPIALGNTNTVVWTGSDMLVWGGSALRAEGARYDPVTDRWRSITPAGAPAPRLKHTAVWTGTEMLVWGGAGEAGQRLNSGARYDPVTDQWRPLAPSPLAPRRDHTAVWTGTEMLVWGGVFPIEGTLANLGARYDPATDHWTLLVGAGAPAARSEHAAVWTGTEMLVWGGWDRGGRSSVLYADGGRYDPARDTWAPITALGAPDAQYGHRAIWTGAEMLLVGRFEHPGRYRPYWLEIMQPTQVYGIADEPLWTARPGERYRVVDIEGDWSLVVWEGDPPSWSVWIRLTSGVALTRA